MKYNAIIIQHHVVWSCGHKHATQAEASACKCDTDFTKVETSGIVLGGKNSPALAEGCDFGIQQA